jgi:hypothetical protein
VSLSFRNVDADSSDPVETWPYEALVTAIERGTIHDWAKITAAIRRELLRRAVRRARAEAEISDPEEVAPASAN